MDTEEGKSSKIIQMHQNILDDLVNVNSLFSAAVFLGMTFVAPRQESLETRSECNMDPLQSKRVVLCNVVTFACFLLSSLAAKSLKAILCLVKSDVREELRVRALKKILLDLNWRRFLLGISVLASFAGIVSLTMSMIITVQLKLGKVSCGSHYAKLAVATLIAIVSFTLLLYTPSMVYSITAFAVLLRRQESRDSAPRRVEIST